MTPVYSKPLYDRVIVILKEEQISSGLIKPDVSQERIVTGEVQAVGPGMYDPATRSFNSLTVKPGDIVRFNINHALKMPKRSNVPSYYIIREFNIDEILLDTQN